MKIFENGFSFDKLNQIHDNLTGSINDNVKDWFLMQSPIPVLGISFFYLFLILFLSRLMKHIPEINIKLLIFCYNLVSIQLNVYISFKILYIKYKAKDFYFCTTINANDTKDLSLEMNRIIWIFFIAKGIEFLDTIFLLIRKKYYKISFLHVYNHATMFPIWWYVTAFHANGTLAGAALLNSLIHALMYYYYAISIIGPSYQKWIWWKKYLTVLQMLQFAIVILFCSFLLYKNCQNDQIIWSAIYYSLSHVILIYEFYSKSYYKIMYEQIDKKDDSFIESEVEKEASNLNRFFFNNKANETDFKITVSKRRALHS